MQNLQDEGGLTLAWAIQNDAQRAALTELFRSEESDRVVAVIGGALLDDSLRGALASRLRQSDSIATSISDKLFMMDGPLGNTGPKIDLAYQLYAIEKPVHEAMHGICRVRNAFAHQLDLSFGSTNKDLVKALNKLNLHDGLSHYPDPFMGHPSSQQIEGITSSRVRFLVNLQLSLILLMRDGLVHQPWSNIPRNYGPIS